MEIPKNIPMTMFGTVGVDIHDKIDWNAGDFGDHYSCLWGQNTRQRDWFNSQDNLRILRVYDSIGTGFGRALILSDDWNPNIWILFNTFPMEGALMYLDVYGMLLKYILKENGILVDTYRAHLYTHWKHKPPWLYTNFPVGIAAHDASVNPVNMVSLFYNS